MSDDSPDKRGQAILGGGEQAGDDTLGGGIYAGAGGGVGVEDGAEIGERALEIGDGAAVGLGGVGFEGEAQPGLDRVVGDDTADGGADFGGAGGIFLEAGDFAADPFIERGAQLGAIGGHLVELAVDGGEHAAGDGGADSPAD